MCRKFECRQNIHCPGRVAKNATPRPSGWESNPRPDLGLIMYILTTLEFPTHYFDFHLFDIWLLFVADGCTLALFLIKSFIVKAYWDDTTFPDDCHSGVCNCSDVGTIRVHDWLVGVAKCPLCSSHWITSITMTSDRKNRRRRKHPTRRWKAFKRHIPDVCLHFVFVSFSILTRCQGRVEKLSFTKINLTSMAT